MDASARHYTHHAACGCTFDQEDAPVTPCPEAARLFERRATEMAGGTSAGVRAADAAYHEHLATALADAKA